MPWDLPEIYFETGPLVNWLGEKGWLIVDGLNGVFGWALDVCR